MNDQREYNRISAQVNVAAVIQCAPGAESLRGRQIQCQTRDISMTGICLYTDIQLPVGASVQIRIEFGSPANTFNLSGKVIWSATGEGSGQFRIGIHLTRLPENTAAWNSAVIQTLAG